MAEFKDRSLLFKILYVLLFILTFPIFLLLFIFRHPLWVLAVLLFTGGFAIYYPINNGVKFDDIVPWYKKKYVELKYETVLKARQKGVTELVPQVVLEEVKKIEEEAHEATLPKGENYNKKVIRSPESEELKNELKQRRGFKKKEIAPIESDDNGNDKEASEKNEVSDVEQKAEEVSVEQPVLENEPELVKIDENLAKVENNEPKAEDNSAEMELNF